MPYLGSYTGDYLGSYRGDPGFFDFVKKGVKFIGGKLLGASPVGGVIKTVGGAAIGAVRGRGRQIATPVTTGGGMPSMASLSGGRTAKEQKAFARAAKRASGERVYRRMNVTNPRALRRAIRRQQGFVKLARRALRGTGYTITTRGRSRPRAVTVRESGPGGVVVR